MELIRYFNKPENEIYVTRCAVKLDSGMENHKKPLGDKTANLVIGTKLSRLAPKSIGLEYSLGQMFYSN
jgi:hypothetical protein